MNGFHTNLLRTMAVAAAFSMAAVAVPCVAATSVMAVQGQDHRDHVDQDQAQQYRNNSFYTLGNREGYEDYQAKSQRKEHNHKYRNDEDRKAHDYGYKQGWQGQQATNGDNDRPH
ncbi:hypothetical protein [Tunturiibacter gelidoferens]|uniref:Lipoprotein n=1 Tax=Tunturiibacter lichenicola TaxID=2051959 RepID=A0A7Y9T4Q9_9BACT|nr:hypothetical protein [Edaphobacter lichenicola]NYF53771.1 hypothetical protein [Edaphobacter lichenicola]